MRTRESDKFHRGFVGSLMKAEWREDLHPRDDSGKFSVVPGLGTKAGPIEIFDEAELRATLPKTKTGKQFFEQVNVDLIQHAFKYDESLGGLRALIFRKDGRKVYKYTDEHIRKKSEKKFAKQVRMEKSIDKIRARVDKDLKARNEKKRAAATIVKLIDTTTMRIGGGKSESDTGSRGASTLRAENFIENPDGTLQVQFRGKSKVDWDRKIEDPALVEAIKGFLKGKKGDDLVFPVNAREVNQYLQRWKVTAKDFRTFHASQMAFSNLQSLENPKTMKELKANVKAAIERVAEALGHTPAVCKSSYVNPYIIHSYEEQFVSLGKKKK